MKYKYYKRILRGCHECPHIAYVYAHRGKLGVVCSKMRIEFRVIDKHEREISFPDWCPLEDVEE